jgi:hypothetical protein
MQVAPAPREGRGGAVRRDGSKGHAAVSRMFGY